MSDNKLIKILQLIIIGLIACISPGFAQTLFTDEDI